MADFLKDDTRKHTQTSSNALINDKDEETHRVHVVRLVSQICRFGYV